jgi:putative spermidine/putrescine transport system substrate-binding protein
VIPRARHAIAAVALLLMAAAAPTPHAPPADDTLPQPLAAAIPPGPTHDALIKTLLRPYADATSTPLTLPAWDGTPDALKPLLTSHAADLLLLNGPTLATLCHAGALVKLDWSTLGRDRFITGATTDCGAGVAISATILAWDRDKLPGAPGWADFWDVAKHPGRRGLHRGARGNLELALLADGVAPGDIYRTLRSTDGADRAFRKLDQLKPYILWWDTPAQPAQLLAGAKVLLTSAPSAGLPSGPKTHVGTQWDGALTEVTSLAQPTDSPHPHAAQAALTIALDPARDAALARATGTGPGTKAAFALLPADVRADNPALPAHLQSALAIDDGFWAESGDKLEARFTAWIGK